MEQITHLVRTFADWLDLQARDGMNIVRTAIDQAAHWRATPYVITAALLLTVYVRYLSWKAGWLSGAIDKEIRRMQRRKLKSIIEIIKRVTVRGVYRGCRAGLYRSIDVVDRSARRDVWSGISAFYFPSFASFFIVGGIILALFVLPHIHAILLTKPLVSLRAISDELADEETVRKVFEGLIVIAVALIVFVAESIRDTRNTDQKRVLLRISGLWPLTVAVTLFPVGYLFGKLTGWITTLIILVSLWAILQFARVIRNLLDADLQEENKKRLLKDRVRDLIMQSIRERVGNNILFRRIGPDREIKLRYTLSRSWIGERQREYIFIDSPRSGWISDVNFHELRSLADVIERQLNKLGFDLYERPSTTVERPSATAKMSTLGGKTEPPQRQPRLVKEVYIFKRFGEMIPPESIFSVNGKAVLALPRVLGEDTRFVDDVQTRVQQIFRFSNAEPSSIAFRREMRSTKDQLVAAIRSISLGAVEELRQTYLSVAEEFLETLNELGGGYTAEQAREERGNIFQGWNEIRWLREDISELLGVAADTDNRDIIADIASLPMAIATRAVMAHDHLLFQEFAAFFPHLYFLASVKPSGSEVQRFMTERAWRYPKQIADYYIIPQHLRDEGASAKVEELEGFALFTFKIFQDLARSAFGKRDIGTFRDVLRETKHLFERFKPEREHPSAAFLRAALARSAEEGERIQLQRRLGLQQQREAVGRRIDLARDEIVFGLAAYILDRYVQSDDVEVKRFFDEISGYLPRDLRRLTLIFQSVNDHHVADYWGWSHWDLVADGQAHFVDTHTKPNQLYCVQSLRILDTLSVQEISRIKLPPSESLSFLSTETNPQGLPRMLETIRAQSARWDNVIEQRAMDRADALLLLLNEAKEAESRAEQDELITAQLDAGKLRAFVGNLHETLQSSGVLKPLFKYLGVYEEHGPDQSPRDLLAWGFNQLDEKGPYVEKSRVSYPGWGEGYGRSLAHAEDQIGFLALNEHVADRSGIPATQLIAEIGNALSTKVWRNPVLLETLTQFAPFDGFTNDMRFISSYRNDCPLTPFQGMNGFIGVFRRRDEHVPVFRLYVEEEVLQNKVLLLDLPRFAKWDQYNPVHGGEEQQYISDFLYVKVTDLNIDDARRETLINENPEWLREQVDKDRFLRARVILNIYEKFRVHILDRSGASAWDVTPEDNE
jgi:hypothetical protein